MRRRILVDRPRLAIMWGHWWEDLPLRMAFNLRPFGEHGYELWFGRLTVIWSSAPGESATPRGGAFPAGNDGETGAEDSSGGQPEGKETA